MTVEELANKRYGGEFVFMLGHLEGVTRFVFECFDPRPDHEGKKYICMFDVNILMIDTGQKVASNWNPTEHDIMSNDWEIAG